MIYRTKDSIKPYEEEKFRLKSSYLKEHAPAFLVNILI